MRKTNPVVNVELEVRNGQWTVQPEHGKLEVEPAPTITAVRRRLRKAVTALHGPQAEIRTVIKVPPELQARVARNRSRRLELREARVQLSAETVELVNVLRHQLGASYDDAAEVLGIDAAVLNRLVQTNDRVKFGGSDDDSE